MNKSLPKQSIGEPAAATNCLDCFVISLHLPCRCSTPGRLRTISIIFSRARSLVNEQFAAAGQQVARTRFRLVADHCGSTRQSTGGLNDEIVSLAVFARFCYAIADFLFILF
jgi:hypothetical protein